VNALSAPRRALIVCLGLLTAASSLQAVAHATRVVRVYDLALGSAARSALVTTTAASILDDAGVELEWLSCGSHPPANSPCRMPRASGDLVVRIMPEGNVAAADGQFAMGYAVVDAQLGVATMATVFAGRVERLGHQSRSDVDVLLGRAVAHEVGHLLLRSAAHSRFGLMREVWTDAELYRNRPEDWVFTSADRAGLRAATGVPTAVATN
jgi:hypothetical protein